MCNYPGVNHSFVKYDGKNLQAYITPHNIDIFKLKNFLKEELAPYAVPSKILALDKFPTNAAGKVDEDRLPTVDEGSITLENPPATKKEIEISEYWQKILFKGKHPISLTDNFFDLGGSSIDAMKLTRVMQDNFHPDFPMELIYKYPILKDFIRELDNIKFVKVEETPWQIILLDALKSFPSTLYYYLVFSMPSLILTAIFFYFPILALCLIVAEFTLHYLFKFPDTLFLRKIKVFLQSGKWKYNSVKVLEDYPLERMPRCVFTIHPHGITEDHMFPFEKHLLSKNINYKILIHETLFKIPFSKTLFKLLAGLPASKSSYNYAEKKDLNLLVTPGDGPEGFRADEQGAIALSAQKLFFKYILETGTPLTPVYFHNNYKAFKLFKHFYRERNNLFKKNRSFVLIPYWGRWYLPIPHKIDLLITIGTPLMVEKIENPSWADVEELYSRYLKHLRELYKMHAPTGAELTFY